ncbi:survival protein sure-like phosphatase/nucleotidase [Chlamydoabsidia padenii]|nr:survival protein sure-like phosphatase/nucleotidase [Chlamydoabsidia padenii]
MPLRVLICNDDGPPHQEESPFIMPFIEYLEQQGWQVTACLPNSQKSWIGKSLMIRDKISVSYYHRDTKDISHQQRHHSDLTLLNGTPATCVNIALYHLFKHQTFDLVLVGPNFGRNTATIFTLASGTIGGALEATMCGRKSIALSFPFYSRDFSPAAIQNACVMATKVILQLVEKNQWPDYGLFNINVPLIETNDCPVYLTRFHQAHYGSLFKPLVQLDATGPLFRFAPDIKAMSHPDGAVAGTDTWTLQQKCISVTPMVASYAVASLDIDYGVELCNKL